MRKNIGTALALVSLLMLIGIGIRLSSGSALARFSPDPEAVVDQSKTPVVAGGFSVEVIVDGRRLQE